MFSKPTAIRTFALAFCAIFALSGVQLAAATPGRDEFQYIVENEWESATLTVETTPVSGGVFVNGESWGFAPQTRHLDPGTYTVSFGSVDGYYTPDPEGVALDAGDSITVVGVYTPIPAPTPSPSPTPTPSRIPDFSVSISPASRTITQGESASYAVTVRSIDGFSGRVALNVTGTPSSSSYSLPASVSVGSAAIATLVISTTNSTPAGDYTLSVTGVNSSGSMTRSASAELVVTENEPIPVSEPDFTVSISPGSRRILNKIKVQEYTSGRLVTREVDEWGSSHVNRQAGYTVTVTSIDGFTGTVSLRLSGMPGSSSYSLPSSVWVPANGQAISTLTTTTTSSTPPNTCTLTVTGSCGSMTRSASATLKVEEETKLEGVGAGYSGPIYDGGSVCNLLGGSSSNSGSVTRTYTVDMGNPTISVSTATGMVAVPNYVNETVKNDAIVTATACNNRSTPGQIVDTIEQGVNWANQHIVQPVVNNVVEAAEKVFEFLKKVAEVVNKLVEMARQAAKFGINITLPPIV